MQFKRMLQFAMTHEGIDAQFIFSEDSSEVIALEVQSDCIFADGSEGIVFNQVKTMSELRDLLGY